MARAPAVQSNEPLPEADCLEGYPHPRQTRIVHGHGGAEAEFGAAFGGGRIHHAWLVTGPEGIGKATFAYRLACYVLAEPHERGLGLDGSLDIGYETTAARQVRALSHPGLLVIRRPYDIKTKRFSSAIPVDAVRRLRGFLSHASAAQSWRVVIVDQADELNVNAANALLKSLEEPPARALFLLISSEPGRLLTTIRSRCRRLALGGLDDAALRAAVGMARASVEKPDIDAGDWTRLAGLARGSVRRALWLAEADGLRLYDRGHRLVASLPRLDWEEAHGLADELTGAGSEQRFETFFDLFFDLVARLVRARATGDATSEDGKMAQRAIPDGGLASWALLWETVVAKKAEALALNLDRKTLLLDTFGRLEAAARR